MKAISQIVSVVLGLNLVFAQIGRGQDVSEKTVKVRFRVLGWDDSSTDLNYDQNKKDVSLAILQENRSIFYDYTGPADLDLYKLKPDKDGKIDRVVVARANLGNAGPWPLLILFRNLAKPDLYDVKVIPDDLVSFPTETYRFVDFSKYAISGSLGAKTFKMQPGDIVLLRSRPSGNRTTLFANLSMESGGEKIPIYTNNWAHQPAARTMVFIMPTQETPTGVVARRLIESTCFPSGTPALKSVGQ